MRQRTYRRLNGGIYLAASRPAGTGAFGVERGQLGPDVIGFRGAKDGEQGQSMLPVVPGPAVVAGDAIGKGQAVVSASLFVLVAYPAGQRERGAVLGAGLAGLACREQDGAGAVVGLHLTGPVADLDGQPESLAVVLRCPVIAALPSVDDAESGQHGGLTLVIADLAEQDQRPMQAPGGLLVTALQAVGAAEIGQRASFAGPVVKVSGQDRCLPVVIGGLPVAALPFVDDAQVVQRRRFAEPVTDLTGNPQRPPVMTGGLPVAALPPVDDAEVGQGGRLGGAIPGAASGVAGRAVDGNGIRIMTAGLKVAVQGAGQAGGMSGPAVSRGMRAHGDQHGPLGVEPGASGGGVRGSGRRRGGHAPAVDAGPQMPLSRDQGVHGRCRSRQIVVEEAGQRGMPLAFGIPGGRQAGRVGAQQVMQAVAARAGAVDQVGTGEKLKRAAGLGGRDAGERGGGAGVKIGTRAQAQQAERPGRLVRQVTV